MMDSGGDSIDLDSKFTMDHSSGFGIFTAARYGLSGIKVPANFHTLPQGLEFQRSSFAKGYGGLAS